MSKNSNNQATVAATVPAEVPPVSPAPEVPAPVVATVPASAPEVPVIMRIASVDLSKLGTGPRQFAVQVQNAARRIDEVVRGPEKVSLLQGVPNSTRAKISDGYDAAMRGIEALMVALSEIPSDAKPDPIRPGVVVLLRRAAVAKSTYYSGAAWRRSDLLVVGRFSEEAEVWYEGCKVPVRIPAKDVELSDATETEREAFTARAKEAGIRW